MTTTVLDRAIELRRKINEIDEKLKDLQRAVSVSIILESEFNFQEVSIDFNLNGKDELNQKAIAFHNEVVAFYAVKKKELQDKFDSL